jgi:hypothetical protein
MKVLICVPRYEHERDRRLIIQKKIDELNIFMKQCVVQEIDDPCMHLMVCPGT